MSRLVCVGIVLCALLAGCNSTPAGEKPVKVLFDTTAGQFLVEVHADWAPLGAERFLTLVREGYFDDCRFFRVVPGWVVQFGINGVPSVTARWDEKTIMDDPVERENRRGRLAFAASGPDTRTTQVFVNLADNQAKLDPQGFAVFGEVVKGMDVIDRITDEYLEAPKQGVIHEFGNAYLDRDFPRLDHIRTARIVP